MSCPICEAIEQGVSTTVPLPSCDMCEEHAHYNEAGAYNLEITGRAEPGLDA